MTHAHTEAGAAADHEGEERAREAFTGHMPAVVRLARLQHRGLHGEMKEDAVAETVARTWHSYRSMALQGEDPAPLVKSMVRYAAKHVRAGKLLGRSEARDVLSRITRGEGGYFVASLPHADEEAASEVLDGLRHRVAGPAEEAITKIDYETWLGGLSQPQREVAEGLASGLNVSEVARQRGVSKASVQQVQKTLGRKWDEFHGEGPRTNVSDASIGRRAGRRLPRHASPLEPESPVHPPCR